MAMLNNQMVSDGFEFFSLDMFSRITDGFEGF